jgi:regulator of protease activity HflC (stomatin/prohibitin superfamily)
VERYSFSFRELTKEEQTVEISEEISRSFEDRQILQRSKEVTARRSKGFEAKERQSH